MSGRDLKIPLFPALFGSETAIVSTTYPLSAVESAALAAMGFELPDFLRSAVAVRQYEFLAGRYCALKALAQLGGEPVLRLSPDGLPEWPRGFVGSIAHGHGRAAAAAAPLTFARGLGIDCEQVMSGERAGLIKRKILTDEDERTVSECSGWSEAEKVTFVFSAKEAIYKCLAPLCGQFFGFQAAGIESVDERTGDFGFVLKQGVGQEFASGWRGQGRFARAEGWVFSGVLAQ